MTRVVSILLFWALLTVAVGCGGSQTSGTTGGPISFRELAAAASSSVDAARGRFEFSMEMTYPGASEAFSFTGSGAFDSKTNRAAFTLDLSSLASLLGQLAPSGAGAPDLGDPKAWQIEAVQDNLVLYMRFPAVDEYLPEGKSWVRMDLEQAGRSQGFDLTQLQNFTKNDPRKMLGYLRAVSGDIETVGTEELRGVDTTHYHATVDLLRYAKLVPPSEREKLGTLLGDVVDQAGVRELPLDVWVDGFGLVRKTTMSFSATQPGTSEAAHASVSFELYDYGKDVAIALPPSGEVVDASALQG